MRRSLVIASLSLVSATAVAQDADIRVTNTLVTEYRGDNQNGQEGDDDYGIIYDRLNITGAADGITTQLRLDGSHFYEPPTDQYQGDARIERLRVDFDRGDWTFTGGDFAQQLGRGIMLSMRPVEGVGRDLAIRGGRAEYSGDEHRGFAFAGHANTVNLDPVSQAFQPDNQDLLTGGLLETRAIDGATIQLYTLYTALEERLLDELTTTANAGLSVDMPTVLPWAGLYAEVDAQSRSQAGIASEGWAAYTTADIFAGDNTILLEAMALSDFRQQGSTNVFDTPFFYNQPPTLQRFDQQVINFHNTVGGRARLEHYFFEPDLLVYAETTYRQDDFDQDNAADLLHGLGGMEWRYGDMGENVMQLSGGYRDLRFASNGDSLQTMAHVEVDWLKQLSDAYSLHLQVFHEERTQTEEPNRRGSTFLGVDRKGVAGVTIEYGYDTLFEGDGIANHFLAGIFSWEASEALTLRSVVGTQRGGIKCAAGVCRMFPAFAGARIEAVARF